MVSVVVILHNVFECDHIGDSIVFDEAKVVGCTDALDAY